MTGGAIGWAFPAATGAAIACPGRRVVCLQGDGGGMYTLQALWTQARERLDVVNIVFANRRYAILQGELAAAGARPGPASEALFDLGRPALGWTKLAEGLGVEAARVETLRGFRRCLLSRLRPARTVPRRVRNLGFAPRRARGFGRRRPAREPSSLAPVLDERIGGRYHHEREQRRGDHAADHRDRERRVRRRPPRGRTPPEGARAPPSPRS
ncbi:MAG: thiamine pyrophosphate-dependent enzyme [Burkholderiales bacterium]|nr:thiamine pyrophosphate-dependent enzyme [Burkholderiales bacterium]